MKTKILSFVLCFALLFSLFTLSAFADEEPESENREVASDRTELDDRQRLPELKDFQNNRDIINLIVEYFPFDYSFNGSGIYDFGISYFESIDILLSDGYYIRLSDLNSRTLPERMNLDYDDAVYGFFGNTDYIQQVDYAYTVLDQEVFRSDSQRYYIIFSPYGVFVFDGNRTIVVRDYVAFRLVNITQDHNDWHDPVYYGSSSSDYEQVISLDNYCDYIFGNNQGFTLSDWFFDVAYPVFGSTNQDTLDLGIFGTYQPMQLYKFLFCLALVIASIILLIWLPLHLFLRLIGVKRKKKG